jgi:hypothetical protein
MRTQTYEEFVDVLLTAYGSGGVPVKEQQDATSCAQELTCKPEESTKDYVQRVCEKLAQYQGSDKVANQKLQDFSRDLSFIEDRIAKH